MNTVLKIAALVLFLIILPDAFAADPLTIRFPERPTIPQPMPSPAPAPVAAEKLAKGQWYVIDADKQLLVDAFGLGAGAVTITERKGPLTLPAEIAVGRTPDKDDPDVCTITGPFVYVVKASESGTVILQVLPAVNNLVDGKPVPFTRADVKRRALEVDAGRGPQPPPVDPEDKKPKPAPTPKAEQILVITVSETFNRTPALGKLLLDPLWENLKTSGHAYLHLDKDDPILDEKKWRPLLTDKDKKTLSLPAVLVLNRSTGEKLAAFPLVDTTKPTDLAATLKGFQK